MQHIEFFHTDHFNHHYHRVKAPAGLSRFIDFFWETEFDELWDLYPGGFSDVLFPNTGYTYLINLGTPFVMQVAERKFDMKTDGFLPRHQAIECYHRRGNRLFGIKFNISPVIFEKKINFSEYREYIFPLSYLVDNTVLSGVKQCRDFQARVSLLSNYFLGILQQYEGSLQPIRIVSEILAVCNRTNHFTIPVEELAMRHHVSARTLQRYFEVATGIGTKKALQIMRIRKATEQLVKSPGDFNSADYGYYDHSHFYKHLRLFLRKRNLEKRNLHLLLLAKMHVPAV